MGPLLPELNQYFSAEHLDNSSGGLIGCLILAIFLNTLWFAGSGDMLNRWMIGFPE
jgi:hypothetical protein